MDQRLQRAYLDWSSIWQRSRENWHWPLLPAPRPGRPKSNGEFPFENYAITIDLEALEEGPLYVENLFDHLIVHYTFCPRSLETAGLLALSASRGLRDPRRAREVVNVFSDIVVDSFRLERSSEDEEKVLLGWRRLACQETGPVDRVVLGFLAEYWGAPLPGCDRPEVEMLLQTFSPGVRERGLWPRQCQQLARILEPLSPGVLGRGQVRALEILNGSADSVPFGFSSGLEPREYEQTLSALGLMGDLKRWYRDQSYSIEIRSCRRSRRSSYPTGPARWRLSDPWSDLDAAYSLSLSPRLVPGVTTYKREREEGLMAPGPEEVPDLLVVLDSSRSMEGHSLGSKTHRATLAAFKACHYARSRGAEVAAINFSDRYLEAPWTGDLDRVEDVLVEFLCGRTQIPGRAVRERAEERPGCLILCITDTHIQNLYLEWEELKRASEAATFVLFCIDQEYRDRHVEGALSSLGEVYYINRLEELVSLVVDTTERAYGVND